MREEGMNWVAAGLLVWLVVCLIFGIGVSIYLTNSETGNWAARLFIGMVCFSGAFAAGAYLLVIVRNVMYATPDTDQE